MCRSCLIADTLPDTGYMNAGCTHCDARAVAHCQEFFDAIAAGQPSDAYRAVLARVFPNESASAAHLRVAAWADRISKARAKKFLGCDDTTV